MFDTESQEVAEHILRRIQYFQQNIFDSDVDDEFLRMICHHLYMITQSAWIKGIKVLAIDLWRFLPLVYQERLQKEISNAKDIQIRSLHFMWQQLLESDSSSFLVWLEEQSGILDSYFKDDFQERWMNFKTRQARHIYDRSLERQKTRRECLRRQVAKRNRRAETLARYEVASSR